RSSDRLSLSGSAWSRTAAAGLTEFPLDGTSRVAWQRLTCEWMPVAACRIASQARGASSDQARGELVGVDVRDRRFLRERADRRSWPHAGTDDRLAPSPRTGRRGVLRR